MQGLKTYKCIFEASEDVIWAIEALREDFFVKIVSIAHPRYSVLTFKTDAKLREIQTCWYNAHKDLHFMFNSVNTKAKFQLLKDRHDYPDVEYKLKHNLK